MRLSPLLTGKGGVIHTVIHILGKNKVILWTTLKNEVKNVE